MFIMAALLVRFVALRCEMKYCCFMSRRRRSGWDDLQPCLGVGGGCVEVETRTVRTEGWPINGVDGARWESMVLGARFSLIFDYFLSDAGTV